ncbi:MAG: nitronate monooxygenase [Actinophytocola sp.]|uniref:NAD(P)H-dependent flavin oxidoreductase n=1 Tax=Actinophytocola sp. TaxID=1872138 RepID=UPI00132750FA|nr:nitronate monooxygenase [Actinophytocola sp.]MPZ83630.1 nitronate monooxygenase [Actinophytocola sp.]
MTLPATLARNLALPLIAAPMTGVSGPDLVVAACRAGVIGSFPTHNARTVEDLDRWLRHVNAETGGAAPFAPNLVVHRTNDRLAADVDCLVRHGVELVITSVGSPAPVLGPLRDAGCLVFADVATMRHVDRALDAGADGLVLLTAGAGGQTGAANPLAFVRAVREVFDGPVVVAGGVSDGAALLAARVLGADLCYMGTAFIATEESLADDAYRHALVGAGLDDVVQTSVPSGLPANFLRSWWESQPESRTGQAAPAGGFAHSAALAQRGVWAAGHSVAGVHGVGSVAELVETISKQYDLARSALLESRR